MSRGSGSEPAGSAAMPMKQEAGESGGRGWALEYELQGSHP